MISITEVLRKETDVGAVLEDLLSHCHLVFEVALLVKNFLNSILNLCIKIELCQEFRD